MKHAIILEEASLEIVPKRFWCDESCRKVEERFGVPPKAQILDKNFHSKIVQRLSASEKRDRPDIAHFALLDITSTPAYLEGLVQPIIHTINDQTIFLKMGVRLPRTEQRFEGVMSKLLRNKLEKNEEALFSIEEKQSISNLVRSLNPDRTVCLTREGILKRLRAFFPEVQSRLPGVVIWIVGGFAGGHFSEETKKLADDLISISQLPLPAHVVTARLSYEIEENRS